MLWLEPYAAMPLVVGTDAHDLFGHRDYYFWFFGYVAKLPYEEKVEFMPYPRHE